MLLNPARTEAGYSLMRDSGMSLPSFNRAFLSGEQLYSRIGNGGYGGKASGLIKTVESLQRHMPDGEYKGIKVWVPRFTVITTELFDRFISSNNINIKELSEMPDSNIVRHFLNASLSPVLSGILRDIAAEMHTPLAVRSSSMLEDSKLSPFAGVYGTKMIPNNHHSLDHRHKQLIEAVKFIYATTFFEESRHYLLSISLNRNQDLKTENDLQNKNEATMKNIGSLQEKMAVIIQEIAGCRHENAFYPEVSGVLRSHNYYPFGRAKPEDGVATLAFGLGRTIVQGEAAWNYSPRWPKVPPPYSNNSELMKITQSHFWAVNMDCHTTYNSLKETEYMMHLSVSEAEKHSTLERVASTYDASSDRKIPGVNASGPRIIDFAPMLQLGWPPLNETLKKLKNIMEESSSGAIEMEFALSFSRDNPDGKFAVLQVRDANTTDDSAEIDLNQYDRSKTLIYSSQVLGHGEIKGVEDIIVVDRHKFDLADSEQIALELGRLNHKFLQTGKRYILIGYGRWGSSDHWLGIPVNWSQISRSAMIVEAALPDMHIDRSQGAHFFHNLMSQGIMYFNLDHTSEGSINWEILDELETIEKTEHVNHLIMPQGVKILADGQSHSGLVLPDDH